MHYFKRNIGDYHKKAGRLSMLEHGAYTLLMDACYDREKFPTMEQAIDWCWARSDGEIAAVKFVLDKFFTLDGDQYTQQRIADEIDGYHQKSKVNKQIALDREAARRTKRERIENETCTDRHLTTNQEPLTTNQEPQKNIGDQQADAEQKPTRRNWIKVLISLGVEERFAKDWMAVRKAKKASMTDTALEAIQREAGIAGMTLGEAVKIAAENSWQGFKASWLKKDQSINPAMTKHTGFADRDYHAGLIEREDGSYGF